MRHGGLEQVVAGIELTRRRRRQVWECRAKAVAAQSSIEIDHRILRPIPVEHSLSLPPTPITPLFRPSKWPSTSIPHREVAGSAAIPISRRRYHCAALICEPASSTNYLSPERRWVPMAGQRRWRPSRSLCRSLSLAISCHHTPSDPLRFINTYARLFESVSET